MSKQAHPDHPIHELITRRWSPYCFSERPVSNEDLTGLFEAARWAASSYNEQPWRFIVARRENRQAHQDLLSCLVDANQAWARHAAVLALGVTHTTFARNGKPNRAAEHDLGLAVGNLMLEATARGLAVHEMIGIHPEQAAERYAVPDDYQVLTALAIGYAEPDPSAFPDSLQERDRTPRTRQALDEFVFAGRFGQAGLPQAS